MSPGWTLAITALLGVATVLNIAMVFYGGDALARSPGSRSWSWRCCSLRWGFGSRCTA